MGGRSSIDQLDPQIRTEVDAAIKRGATVDGIVTRIRELGGEASRSAVGRYTKNYAQLARRQRDLQATAKAFASEFGEADDRQSRLLIQLVTSITTRSVMPIAEEEDPGLEGKELANLARAVKDITSAAKIDTDREQKIRAEEAARAKQQAAAAVEKAASKVAGGLTRDTIEEIKREILGVAA